jgi:phthiodiolone/phenolphthiodiolone dimycocerosates ketoreductase
MTYGDAGSSPDAWADPLVLAGLLAGRTELPFGTSVTDATRRRAPDMVRAALTVHHLSSGGFKLGIGSGEAENIVPFGYPFDKPVGKLERFLIEARSLLDHGHMPDGLKGTLGLPAVAGGKGKLELWVAAHGPRALRLAGTYGDGWISVFISPEVYREQREAVAQHAAAAGRSMPPSRCTLIVILGESRAEVVARLHQEPLAKLIAMLAPAELWSAFGLEKPGAGTAGYRDMMLHDIDPAELVRVAPEIPIELLEAAGMQLGSAAEIAELLYPYEDSGVELMTIANFSGFVGGQQRLAAMKDQFVELTQLLTARHAVASTV